jgi:hypothetical protein
MIVRLVLTAILLFLAYTFLNALMRIFFGSTPPETRTESDDQMVQCAACGTYVPKREAIRKKKGGQEYYFCDDKCLKEYKKLS